MGVNISCTTRQPTSQCLSSHNHSSSSSYSSMWSWVRVLQRWLQCSRSRNFETCGYLPLLSHKVMWGHNFTRLSYKIMLCCKFMLDSSLLSSFRYLFSLDFLWAAPLICPNLSHLNELFTRALDPLSHYPAVKSRSPPVVSTPLSISTIASINFLTLPFNLLIAPPTAPSTSVSYPQTSSNPPLHPLPPTMPYPSSSFWPQLPVTLYWPSDATSSPPPLALSPYLPPSPYRWFLPP